ncbi:MAG: YjbQ family protein [Gemmatimonadota bacterium]
MGPSLALPIVDRSLPLGTWQQVVLLGFDTRSRSRSAAITLVGE